MFEKSLYDLIKGLRNHKGNEKEYIQRTLKECRAEIRSQDMDVKATALLKLVYMEMVGHDMSWASFHVLEVMSSPKYHQKRVGYLGAVQSFRPDTEVLMLATNLLKKDIASTTTTVISLPVATLPHVITPSLALSTLSDLLPRLSHSHANIRKKTLVTLYRLALVYPETLRAAWPKIKERLLDPGEDASVTAAIVNVVCELGWRRPHDFLPLAPRLFELLVDGGNNWMAIKLIKLFAQLTPLEPRLVRKLLPPLTNIIRTTPAMSLLYECINGIIQGGILGNDENAETEEIATLCVNKLRGMVMIDGDPNLKYVALLAFNRIVVTHPLLVSQQEDVILECIDSPDITIRIQALDLVQGMVTSDNLMTVVGRLMKQLKTAASAKDRDVQAQLEPGTMDSDEEAQASAHSVQGQSVEEPPLPDDYRLDVIRRILNMCPKNNYANVVDFDWYIDVLTQLVRTAPVSRVPDSGVSKPPDAKSTDVSILIGDELRNVAVKVRAMRSTAVRASEVIVGQLLDETPSGHTIGSGALRSVCWVIGEYANQLAIPEDALNACIQLLPRVNKPEVIASVVQAIAKVFTAISGSEMEPWTTERKSKTSLLIARIIHSFEPLTSHPTLEVQERAVEFIELLKLTAEAVTGQPPSTEGLQHDPPLLLTQAIPSLFSGWELNSVAANAQLNVPQMEDLDLEAPIHPDLSGLLAQADILTVDTDEAADDFEAYYYERPAPTSISSASAPAISKIAEPKEGNFGFYQQADEDSYLDADIVAKRKAERTERNRDDPFYIPDQGESIKAEASTPIHNILQHSNGPDLDIDSIPIMQLDLDKVTSPAAPSSRPKPKPRQNVVISADETLEGTESGGIRHRDPSNMTEDVSKTRAKKTKQGLLGVDSSHIGSFSLEASNESRSSRSGPFDYETSQKEDAEMQQAMKEVERLRLEMQRANERIQVAQGVDVQGTLVKKKKKKSKVAKATNANVDQAVASANGENGHDEAVAEIAVKPKTKKKKKQTAEGAADATLGLDDGDMVRSKKKKTKKKKEEEVPQGTPDNGEGIMGDKETT